MRFYYNPVFKSTVAAKETVVIGSMGFEEITEDEYNFLTYGEEHYLAAAAAKVETAEAESQAEVEEVEPDAETEENDEADFLSSIFTNAARVGSDEESSSKPVELDEDVLAQEELAAANSFESIKELRLHGDIEAEGRVTKGKAHGVYSYQEEAWTRTGDL